MNNVPFRSFFLFLVSVAHFASLACNGQEPDYFNILRLPNSEVCIIEKNKVTYFDKAEKEIIVTLPFEVESLCQFNDSHLFVARGFDNEESVLVDALNGKQRSLPTFQDMYVSCVAIHDNRCYITYCYDGIVTKQLVPRGFPLPSLESRVLSCDVHELNGYCSEKKQTDFDTEYFPQLSGFRIAEILFAGDKKYFKLQRRYGAENTETPPRRVMHLETLLVLPKPNSFDILRKNVQVYWGD